MKNYSFFLLSCALFCSSLVYAQSDCQTSYSKNNKGAVEIRVDHLPSRQWARILIPSELLPLSKGLNQTFQSSFSSSDEATISYDGRTMTYINIARTNFTKDSVKMIISPNLQQIEAIQYRRSGIYGTQLFIDSKTFTCKFN